MYDTSFIIGEDNIDKVCNDICNIVNKNVNFMFSSYNIKGILILAIQNAIKSNNLEEVIITKYNFNSISKEFHRIINLALNEDINSEFIDKTLTKCFKNRIMDKILNRNENAWFQDSFDDFFYRFFVSEKLDAIVLSIINGQKYILGIQEKDPNNTIYGEYIDFENLLFYFYNVLGEKNDPLNYVESQSSSIYINEQNLREEIPLYEDIKEHLFSKNNNNPIKKNNIEFYLSTKPLSLNNSYFFVVSKKKGISVDTINLNKILELR